jgi:hypothetical protein
VTVPIAPASMSPEDRLAATEAPGCSVWTGKLVARGVAGAA